MADLPIEIISAEEAGVRDDPVENGATFADNAEKKARFVAERTDEWAMADDSGICIDALDGRPGVHSARWTSDHVGVTLNALKDVVASGRNARFVSAAALVAPDGRNWIFGGETKGSIAFSPRGIPRPTLPYDVIFIPDGYDRTYAEMSEEEKNSLSHRGKAFIQLKSFILKFLRT